MDKFLKKGVDDKFMNIFRWLNWIIKGKLPFALIYDYLLHRQRQLKCLKLMLLLPMRLRRRRRCARTRAMPTAFFAENKRR